jgi:hypothetical protein
MKCPVCEIRVRHRRGAIRRCRMYVNRDGEIVERFPESY